jgi:hypothetical protein
LTENNSLVPVSTSSVEISTVNNAIPTHLEEKVINTTVQSVIPSSSTEILVDPSETLTGYSPKLGESNRTSSSSNKRIADKSTVPFSHLFLFKKTKYRTKMEPRKIFSENNLNSTPENFTSGSESMRPNQMENNPVTSPSHPFALALDTASPADLRALTSILMNQMAEWGKQFNEQHERLQAVEASQQRVDQLVTELNITKAKLEEMTAERDALKRQLVGSAASIHAPKQGMMVVDLVGNKDKSTDEGTSGVEDKEYPALAETRVSYAAKATVNANQPARRRRVTQGQRKAAARVFLEPSGESGFQSVYLPCRRRMPLSELRGNLRKLKIANHRVLDVSYPANKVVALLVHNEYAKELLERFDAAGIKPIENFDPLDPKVLNDPELADKSMDEKAAKIHEVHRVRCLVALDHIRIPAKYAVARHFVGLGWVESEVLQVMQTGEPLAPPREGGDAHMTDATTAAAAFREESASPSSRRASASSATSIPTDADSGRSNE